MVYENQQYRAGQLPIFIILIFPSSEKCAAASFHHDYTEPLYSNKPPNIKEMAEIGVT